MRAYVVASCPPNLAPRPLTHPPQIPFAFNATNLSFANEVISRYPAQYKKAAMIPLLEIAQKQNKGWTSLSAMNEVARILEVPPMRVYEVRFAAV